jgi:hypothetical protein
MVTYKRAKVVNSWRANSMMLNRFREIAALAIVSLIIGCGGGGDGEAEGYTVDSGAAQKGPLAQGSVVLINELNTATLRPSGKEYTFRTSNNLGEFSTTGIPFSSNYLSTIAWGYYFNEITGKQSTDIVTLSGLSQIGTGGDKVVNLNALSSMAVNRITRLATATPKVTFAAARAKAQKELLSGFYVYNDTAVLSGATVDSVVQPGNLTALDLRRSRPGDQLLAAISGVVMTASASASGSGLNTLLSQIAVDLGDDGLINNSPNYSPSISTQLCTASASTDFNVVATNLNRIYGTSYTAADLSQWIDTSGCVDKVINKFKFTQKNLAIGVDNRSPWYYIGPDDVGQCFSVGGVTGGANAKLYVFQSQIPETTEVVGTRKAVEGDILTLTLNASSVGNYAAFIQRSAPSSKGVCPTTAPTEGLVRTLKFAGTFIKPTSISGLLWVWYAYSGDTPVPYQAWDNDSLTYLHTPENQATWGDVSTTDIARDTKITRTKTGSTVSIARGAAVKGMKVDITATGFVEPWSNVRFNYTCAGNICTVGDAWSDSPGVKVSVKLTP